MKRTSVEVKWLQQVDVEKVEILFTKLWEYLNDETTSKTRNDIAEFILEFDDEFQNRVSNNINNDKE